MYKSEAEEGRSSCEKKINMLRREANKKRPERALSGTW